jgi:hypothetical protein
MNSSYVLCVIITILIILAIFFTLRKEDYASYKHINLIFTPKGGNINNLEAPVTMTVHKVSKKGHKHDLLIIPGIQPSGDLSGTNNLFKIKGKTSLVSDAHDELRGYDTEYLFGSVNDCGLLSYGSFQVKNGVLNFEPNAYDPNSRRVQPRPFGSNCDPTIFSQGRSAIVGPNDSVIPLMKN